MQQASSVSHGLEKREAQMTGFAARGNSLDFQIHVFLGAGRYIFKTGARYDLAVSPAFADVKFQVCQKSIRN